jgi:hypothetical protein
MLIQCTLELIAGILELESERATASFQICPILNLGLPFSNRRFGELKSMAPLWLRISQKKFPAHASGIKVGASDDSQQFCLSATSSLKQAL